jgi:hypothetical protein
VVDVLAGAFWHGFLFCLLVVIVDGFSGTGASCPFERGCAESGKQVPHRAFGPIRNDKVLFVGFEVSFAGFEVSFVFRGFVCGFCSFAL